VVALLYVRVGLTWDRTARLRKVLAKREGAGLTGVTGSGNQVPFRTFCCSEIRAARDHGLYVVLCRAVSGPRPSSLTLMVEM
jgi:hypothetical protein